MNIEKQEIDKLNVVITVKVSKDDYAGKVENALKDARKNAQMPGFRKGMVPAGLIKKMYGKHTLVNEVNRVVVDGLYNYISENKMQVLGEPLPKEGSFDSIDWDTQTDFEFAYEIAIQPEVTIKLDKKVKAPYYKITVDTELIDKQVDAMTNRFGSNVETDITKDEELVSGDFTELDEEGKPLANGFTKTNAYLLLKVIPEADRKPFIGKKAGDVIVFNPMKTIKHEYEVLTMLNLKHEDTRQLNATYSFKINDIKRFVKAEMNQDLFDSVFGEGTVKSEEEFRNKIKESTELRLSINSDYKFFTDFKKQLMETANLPLPEDFLKRWLVEANKERNISPEEVEQELPHFFEDLRWQILKGHFVKENNISVTAEEFKVAAKEFARMQFQQFGYYNPGDEDLDNWANEISKNKEEANRIVDIELDKKLINYFKDLVTLTDKPISLDDFNKLMEEK